MSYFSVEFPLKTELFQEHILEKRFEIGRKIFNALLGLAKNRIFAVGRSCQNHFGFLQ